MRKIFTASWGQLEKDGSNVGDEAIFASQVMDLKSLGDVIIGVMSAVPGRTESEYGAVPFDVGRGRLRAMREGVEWADIVIAGGGELAQDRSSLLYTPFNLHPLRLARRLGRPAFAWSVGIGQGEELARWTPGRLRKWLGYCSGVTVRDRPSLDTLLGLGLDPGRVRLAPDSTFTLAGLIPSRKADPEVLGVAPRNVSNRQGRLLPLEVRRKLRIYREPDVSDLRRKWAALLDGHIDRNGGEVRFFPFHSGSLSNSDDAECRAIMSMMRHSDRATLAMPGRLEEFLAEMSRCRVFVAVPLHGAILSVVTGTVPVAVPYASKGFRFMAEAGIEELVVDPGREDWDSRLSDLVDRCWKNSNTILQSLSRRRDEMAGRVSINLEHFRNTCLGP